METKLIECKLIDVPKADGRTRSFSKAFATKLAESLKIDGQIHPIMVRPNTAKPGRYILVSGRHRLYGMKDVLKERFIRATVTGDMNDAEAEIAGVVENLWRDPLRPAQHVAAVKMWHAHWLSMQPSHVVSARQGRPESDARLDAAIAEVTGHPVATVRDIRSLAASSPEHLEAIAKARSNRNCRQAVVPAARPARSAPRTEADFDARVAATTGQSLRSVARTKQIANAFTPDQLEVFAQMGVNQTDMVSIARIKDEGLRAEVVNLVACGMGVADAINVVEGVGPVPQNGSGKPQGRTASKMKSRSAAR